MSGRADESVRDEEGADLDGREEDAHGPILADRGADGHPFVATLSFRAAVQSGRCPVPLRLI
jgi:hypothetical protein